MTVKGARLKHYATLKAKIADNSVRVGACRFWKSGDRAKAPFVRWQGKVDLVARLMWSEKHGPIPRRRAILQKCRHRGCIALRHLYLARRTPANAILTAQQVLAVRRARGSNVEIGRRFGVSARAASDIRLGETWKDI